MKKRELIPVTAYDQEPPNMTETEAREFWDTHAFTEEYLASAPPVSDDDFPPVRPERPHGRPRLPVEMMHRLKQLAWQRGVNVDVLIQELIEQGLDAEESRLRTAGS